MTSSNKASQRMDSKPPSYEPPEFIIAVMGATGAGKSSFLNLVSGANLGIGHGLTSKTDKMQIVKFNYGGRQIILVDTPGFDDTKKSDTEILKLIADWLHITYKHEKKLTGIIYLHRITDNRVGGIGYKNIQMFRKLCGDKVMGNVVLCTTMWDQVSPELGAEREQELMSDFWKPMLDHGATVDRHDQGLTSANRVIQNFMALHRIDLDIQIELQAGKTLLETSAGEEINKEILALQKKHEESLAEAHRDMQEAIREKDFEMQQMIRDEQQKLEKALEKSRADQERLAADRRAQMEALERQVEQLKNRKRGFWDLIGEAFTNLFT